MKTTLIAVGLISAFAFSGVAQAQIKAGIQPKPWSQVRAEQAAKAEREALRLAGGNRDVFDRMDTNRDGRISREEYRAAGVVREALEDHLRQRGSEGG